MVLPDTSAWIDFLTRPGSTLGSHIAATAGIAHTEPVLMELLSGARTEREWESLRRLLLGTSLLAFDSLADFESAARLRREARSRGISVGMVDCLIVAVAQRTGARLLTLDRQQARIARMIGVEAL